MRGILQEHIFTGDDTLTKRKKGNILVPTAKRDRPQKVLLPKLHILDKKAVWYCSFWSELPKKHPNLTILASKFVP